MTVPGAIVPIVASIVTSVVLSLAVMHGEDAAGAARFAYTVGATRGPIVDRNGQPLAWTESVNWVVTRRYASPSLTIPLGYQQPNGGWTGIESRYSGDLRAAAAQHDWRSFFLNLRGTAVRGGTVQVTLDRRLQRVADRALGAGTGAVVAIDPRTGAILALVSKPYCWPARLRTAAGEEGCVHNGGHPLLDRATHLLVPPGSAFKIVTLTAALDTHAFTLDTLFSGADAFGPSPYFDNVEYPSNVTRSDLTVLTLSQALAFSDNFTFAHVGLTLGARTLLRYAHRYFVGRKVPFDLPVAVSRIADGRSHPSLSVLAQSSFGAATDRVTPLQMSMIVAAVANRGVLMAPHLVSDVRTASGTVTYRYHPHPLDRVMTAAAARQVTRGMEFVVNHGSGFEAQIPGVAVGGKTGTADSGADRPHAWFISFAPANRPVIAVAVLHEFSGEGFSHAAPIARAVMVAALRERGLRVR
jgi:peptidoglycan glycosyltransferase